MSFEFDDDEGEFSINYEKVLHQETFLPVTRLLAADLIKNQYMPIGDFIKSLNDNSLEELNEISVINISSSRISSFELYILLSKIFLHLI